VLFKSSNAVVEVHHNLLILNLLPCLTKRIAQAGRKNFARSGGRYCRVDL